MQVPYVIRLMHGDDLDKFVRDYVTTPRATAVLKTWITCAFVDAWEVAQMRPSHRLALVTILSDKHMTDRPPNRLLWRLCDSATSRSLHINRSHIGDDTIVAVMIISNSRHSYTLLTCMMPVSEQAMFMGIREDCAVFRSSMGLQPPVVVCDNPGCLMSLHGKVKIIKRNAVYCSKGCAKFDKHM